MTDTLSKSDSKLELSQLATNAKSLINQSISAATKRAYSSDWDIFINFCARHNLMTLPAEPNTVCLFIAHGQSMKRATSTIVRSLTSISAAHLMAGFDTPTRTEMVRLTVRGLKAVQGRRFCKTHAISWVELWCMINSDFLIFSEKSFIASRDSALLALGWAGALRRSELIALDWEDLEWSEKGVIVLIKKSKTDQLGEGRKIGIPFTEGDQCLATVLRAWRDRVSENNKLKGAIFRHTGKSGKKYFSRLGDRLSARSVSVIVKRYAKFAGLKPDAVSGHSLRRGLATVAASCGIPERVIQRHTGHASTRSLREYIDSGTIWIDNPLPAIYSTFRVR